jgi:hypothetical protein
LKTSPFFSLRGLSKRILPLFFEKLVDFVDGVHLDGWAFKEAEDCGGRGQRCGERVYSFQPVKMEMDAHLDYFCENARLVARP